MIRLGTQIARRARIVLPWSGRWVADVELDAGLGAIEVGERVDLRLDDLVLTGTVTRSEQLGADRYASVTGGAGWSRTVTATHRHASSALTRGAVIDSVARAVGETVRLDPALDTALPPDWVRRAEPASATIERLFVGAPWWIDADGTTRIGARSTFDARAVDVVPGGQPDRGWIMASTTDPRQILPGALVSASTLGAPWLVHGAHVDVSGPTYRATLYRSEDRDPALLTSLRRLQAAIQPTAPLSLLYRYRVVEMDGARVRLQVVRSATGLPDTLPIDLAPGAPGVSAALAEGSTVLVSFIEGDASLPVVTHFERPGQPGFLPVSLAIDASDTIRIGETAQVRIGVGVPTTPTEAFQQRRAVCYGDTVVIGSTSGLMGLVSGQSCSNVRLQ